MRCGGTHVPSRIDPKAITAASFMRQFVLVMFWQKMWQWWLAMICYQHMTSDNWREERKRKDKWSWQVTQPQLTWHSIILIIVIYSHSLYLPSSLFLSRLHSPLHQRISLVPASSSLLKIWILSSPSVSLCQFSALTLTCVTKGRISGTMLSSIVRAIASRHVAPAIAMFQLSSPSLSS